MITPEDKKQLDARGINEATVRQQLANFAAGFPYLELVGAANVQEGTILVPSPTEVAQYTKAWERYVHDETRRVVKFVPASGAASRMFKDLFAFVDAPYAVPTTAFEQEFFAHLSQAPYLSALDTKLQDNCGKTSQQLVTEGEYKHIVRTLLDVEGLNYGSLPKGLLLFHRYAEGARTPMEEHLVEGALYAKNTAGQVQLHFTVSPEHRPLFAALAQEKAEMIGHQYDAQFEITFSEQKASTDTIAVNADNTPFRDADGSLLFRPGGHGALIENLNELEADIVFVKNIDNVVPDRLKESTVLWKKVLAGVLVTLQAQAFEMLEELEEGNVSQERLEEILLFLEQKLHCQNPAARAYEGLELLDYLFCKLNRPMRVCGMVRNVGEPGGGPFVAYNPDGSTSLQILESSQIDMNDAEKKAMFQQGTHFNPVDLVCALRDYEGEKFNLPDYVDTETGFISEKSKDGRALRALELPGLWNGAMSDWNTIFVEVPLETFNPVKTVNDLYREQHQ